MDERKLDKLEKLINLVDEDYVKSDEFVEAFGVLLGVLKDVSESSEEAVASLKDQAESIREVVISERKLSRKLQEQFNNRLEAFKTELQNAIFEVKSELPELREAQDGRDGVDGKDGKDGKDGSPDTGEEIIVKINKVDEKGPKIDAKHIKNLPEATQQIIHNSYPGGFVETPIKAGANITITTDGTGAKVITGSAGGGGTWGSITGTLSNQTDLQSALDAKQATLVSTTNIKTINGTSILGSGDLVVAGTIDGSGTTNELTYWVDTDTIGALAVATYPSLTEISYVKGVTSAIQTQIGTKAAHATTMTIAGTANQITSSAGAQDLSANRTWTLSFPADVIIPTVLTVPNTGLHLLDSNASHDLIIKPGSNLTADKTLTLTTGDADVILDLTAVTDEYVLAYDTGTNTWRGVASSGGASFGTDNQIPYTNAGGTDFDYSANLTFNGTALALAGNQSISQGTITTDVKALDVSSTWNNGAVAFTGIKLNATQTASASTSLLMDLQKDSTSVFKVAKNGAVTIDPGSGFGSGSSNPVLTLRAMYGTSSFYGTASSALAVTGNFQVDGTLQLASGVSFQATGQTVDLNSGNITNLNQITNNGSLSFIKMYHDYNGAAAQASQGIIMRYANRSAGTYPRAAYQVYSSSDSTEIPFMVSSQGFAWLRNSKTDEVALTIKGATSQTANLQNWIDSSDAVLASVAADGNISVPDEAYGAGWNGSLEVPTKNALYDKIETLGGGGNVSKVGTPVDNQIGVWTGDGTIEGDASLTWDGTSFNIATAKNFQIAGGTVLSDSSGTLTLSGIDALDATTEATIESAIDTLLNLTSIQGRTVTLADAGADAILGWDDSASAYENLTQAEVLAIIGDSSATAKGVVELATDAESVTGTDTVRAVTPANLTARLAAPGAIGGTTAAAITGTTITANTGFMPDANDGAYLGQAGTAFSDLFLAEGGVINWDSGDVTITQTGNTLAFAGASTAYTFDADVTVPDEAYGVGWNGSLEVPTKNAVYDKIETLGGSIKTWYTEPIALWTTAGTTTYNTNTTMNVAMFCLPSTITVNSLTIEATSVAVAGTLDLSIYSEDGQTKHISVTTASISASGLVTTAVSSVTLSPGIYYMAVNSNSTADVTIRVRGISALDLRAPTGEPKLSGTVTITAGTPPTTFNPSTDVTVNTAVTWVRLDN